MERCMTVRKYEPGGGVGVRGVPIDAARRESLIELVCGGSSFTAAGKLVGVSQPTAVRFWRRFGHVELIPVFGSGGLGPVVVDVSPAGPVQRRALSSEDRATIQAGLLLKLTLTAIGELIGRDKGVVSREVKRNSSSDGQYRGCVAHRVAAHRRQRPKQFKLIMNPVLCLQIEGWMDQGWSPRLIAEMLAAEHGNDHTSRVSHETIYQALYVQTRGSLRADLHRKLSLKRSHRTHRGHSRHAQSPFTDAFKISDRPAEAADRAVPGHWEGDLIQGPGNQSAIGTLVERTTRFTILLHLPGRHDSTTVADAMIRQMRHLPEHLLRSITWDRGTEMADYARIQLALEAKLYFCDPRSPWQRGTNENTNRLLRFWFEKGSDLSVHTAADLRRVADTLNKRPRPTLGLETPADRLNKLLLAA
jgi:IS30 family transposase